MEAIDLAPRGRTIVDLLGMPRPTGAATPDCGCSRIPTEDQPAAQAALAESDHITSALRSRADAVGLATSLGCRVYEADKFVDIQTAIGNALFARFPVEFVNVASS